MLPTNSVTLDSLKDLYDLIDDTIVADPPYSLKEGNIIKKGYHDEIDKYKELSKSGKQWIIDLEQKEKFEDKKSFDISIPGKYNLIFKMF